LGIDLPGCGLSEFSPKSWDAYSIEALANLLVVAIEQHRDTARGQQVVLIAHSLGCSLSALIASSASPIPSELRKHIIGLIAICPAAAPPPQADTAKLRKLLYIPNPVFDLWRLWDRRGGPYGRSVSRLVGEGSDLETRLLQVRFNEQSKTSVWRRMAWGTLPTYNERGEAIGGMPGRDVWAGVQLPVLLVAGEADTITKPSEVAKILRFCSIDTGHDTTTLSTGSQILPDTSDAPGIQLAKAVSSGGSASDDEFGLQFSSIGQSFPLHKSDGNMIAEAIPGDRKRVVKAFIFPAPASHALLYDRSTFRTLSGLIQDFLFRHIDHRLGLGWQLQHLTDSGKWDVKNVAKWKAIHPVSQPIAGMFVAMKTLREVDEEHTPSKFVQKWKDEIFAVIDISHESPVYDPAQLDKGGIQYHKLPTVSKIPPTTGEVRDFISLVDRLETEISAAATERGLDGFRPLLGVHCHYGFNRTGFFVASYLVERKGFSIQEALDEFEKRRSPGIRHEHFIDTLFVRYHTGLQGSSTL
jgi:pimeloyl-ACP methyl ester carboxylesterase/protein-tyrosine phosphatase